MGSERRSAEITEIATESGSRTEFAYRRLRGDIIAGLFPSGAKLQIDDLKERYGLSASPLREALSRLVSQGFVDSMSQRGFRVSPMNAADLADITLSRQVIEIAALRLAIEKGNDAWEAEILAAYHRLQRLTARHQGRPQADLTAFSELHKAFHAALIAACGSPRLIAEQSRLYDQAERYRQVMMQRYLNEASEQLTMDHHALMDVVLARRTEAACTMLHAHLGLTYEFCFGRPAAQAKPKRKARSL